MVAVIRELDEAVSGVDGVGFARTPSAPRPALAEALGVDAELWVKDETGNVSGSHKGRHLFGVALGHELARRVGDSTDGRYAIASCGNAALARLGGGASRGSSPRRVRAHMGQRDHHRLDRGARGQCGSLPPARRSGR